MDVSLPNELRYAITHSHGRKVGFGEIASQAFATDSSLLPCHGNPIGGSIELLLLDGRKETAPRRGIKEEGFPSFGTEKGLREVYGTSESGVNDERSDEKGRRCRIVVVVTL